MGLTVRRCVCTDSIAVSDLLAYYVCPVCKDHVAPPIYQCALGHVLCADCWQKVSNCPLCRGPRQDIRNLVMEQLAERLRFPCRHCRQFLDYADWQRHEAACDLRPFVCPLPGGACKWEGVLGEIYDHLTSDHRNVIAYEAKEVAFHLTGVTTYGGRAWVLLLNCFGRQFLATVTWDTRDVMRAAVKIIGRPEDAARFTYTLRLGFNNRKLMFESVPQNLLPDSNGDYFTVLGSIARSYGDAASLTLCISIVQRS